jgi:hypothetical protein
MYLSEDIITTASIGLTYYILFHSHSFQVPSLCEAGRHSFKSTINFRFQPQ